MAVLQTVKIVALVSLTLGQSAQGQTTAGAVIADSIEGVRAVISTTDGGAVIAEGLSDPQGSVVFRGLAEGRYWLKVASGKPKQIEVPQGKSGILVVVTGKPHSYVGHVTLLR